MSSWCISYRGTAACLSGHLEWSHFLHVALCWSAETCSHWTLLSYHLAEEHGVSRRHWFVFWFWSQAPNSEWKLLFFFLKAHYSSSCFCHLWFSMEFQIRLTYCQVSTWFWDGQLLLVISLFLCILDYLRSKSRVVGIKIASERQNLSRSWLVTMEWNPSWKLRLSKISWISALGIKILLWYCLP